MIILYLTLRYNMFNLKKNLFLETYERAAEMCRPEAQTSQVWHIKITQWHAKLLTRDALNLQNSRGILGY